jgi:hypothetical protein
MTPRRPTNTSCRLRDVLQSRHLLQGMTAVTRHSIPWVMAPRPPFEDDIWNCTIRMTGPSAEHREREPQEASELQRLFLIKAVKYDVISLAG